MVLLNSGQCSAICACILILFFLFVHYFQIHFYISATDRSHHIHVFQSTRIKSKKKKIYWICLWHEWQWNEREIKSICMRHIAKSITNAYGYLDGSPMFVRMRHKQTIWIKKKKKSCAIAQIQRRVDRLFVRSVHRTVELRENKPKSK